MIPISKPMISQDDRRAVLDAIDSGWIGSIGSELRMFEEEFAKYIGSAHCISCSNGTTALQLALSSLGIESGDEVIIPNLTFAAVANSVLAVGAKPVCADVNLNTWNIDVESIASVRTRSAKAIIVVHSYGMPANVPAILEAFPDLSLIEDCAEAHGASFAGKKVGSRGRLATYSFYANKIITTGEGGCVTTNDSYLAERLKVLRDHGMDPSEKFSHLMPGFNYRMTNIQGAIGRSQLKKIESFIEMRESQEKQYDQNLLQMGFESATILKSSKKVNWLYTKLLPLGIDRFELIDFLKKKGIETRPMFNPISSFSYMQQNKKLNLSSSLELSKRGISLPTYNGLEDHDIRYICQQIGKFIVES